MKYYAVLDQEADKPTILSEVEILEFYWDYWSKQMQKVNKYDQINPQNCIEDFCVVHWAWEVTEEVLSGRFNET
jgi:hypothetical protein